MMGKGLPNREGSGEVKEPTGQKNTWQGDNTFGDPKVGRDNTQIGNLHADGNLWLQTYRVGGFAKEILMVEAHETIDGRESIEEKIETSLFLTDPADDKEKLMSAKGKRVTGTCEWIRTNKTYLSWLNSPSRLLWLSGGPGMGKTMLSVFLTEELAKVVEQSQDGILVYYFCDNKDEKRNTAIAILRGLLFQILQKRRSLIKHFLEDFKPKGESLFLSLESLWRIFEAVVRDNDLGTIYCVLDGLDECDEDSLEVLMKNFKVFFSMAGYKSSTGGVKLIAVSRELPQRIAGELSGFLQMKLDPGSDSGVISDIQRFVSVKVDELSMLITGFNDKLRMHVENALLEGAQGTFLWVGFVADELRGKKCAEIIDTLNSLPKGLPGIYNRMLLQIRDSRRDTAALILRWIVMAIRPLTLMELAAAVDVKPSVTATRDQIIKDYIDFCGPLLKVTESEVGLVHQSAKDYFLRKEPDNDPTLERFRVKEGEASFEIARTCFDYIHNGAFSGGPVWLSGTSSPSEFPLLNYAALHWPEHARRSSNSIESIFDLSGPFCQKKSLLFDAWWKTFWDANEGGGAPSSFSLLHVACYFGILPLACRLFAKGGGAVRLRLRNPANKRDSEGHTPLWYAAERGHDRAVELLLKEGADVNLHGRAGITVLQRASIRGHSRIVKLLLDSGADINLEGANPFSETPLWSASRQGHEQIVELLLGKGANVNALGGYQGTALQGASYGGHYRIAELLLKSGADVNAQVESYFSTALQGASYGGNEQIVKLLLEKGANTNAHGGYYGTALRAASSRGYDRIVELLLEKGANINDQRGPPRGETALHLASRNGHNQTVELLVERGADVNALGYYGTALQEASHSGHEQVVELLVEKGADVSAHGGKHSPPLQEASSGGHYQIVKLLLEKGVDVNSRVGGNDTALQVASRSGHSQIVELLLEKGANANTQGGFYGTALQAASYGGHIRTVELLLEKGADVNAKGGQFGLALQAASFGGHNGIVELLLEKGANVNAQGGRFGVALEAASHNGHYQTVELLLERGADVSAQGGYYDTALQAALDGGHNRIAELLRSTAHARSQ
ncbi:hypothetical protein FGG08_003327 [Glutinoglossum americanum]|uniref:NACHT domain-containing protein n=1 Tax=Glutinoglossum americanum TaxID=1670608 RepID=A0A9P8I4M6_9PEZI|nr:hypothetical protein FGG08_003327 [Glutinoglossum americanum]